MDKNFKFDLQLFGDYDNMITRTNVASMVPQEVSREVIQAVPAKSIAMSMFRRLPDMATNQLTMPVQSALPQAYFTNGDGGLRKNTSSEWTDKYIYAEELSAIIPISEAVLEDASYDIWGQTKPAMIEALGLVIDQAVFFGTGKPTNWPTDIVAGAIAAGNYVAFGTGADIADDLGGSDGVMSKIESDGYDVNGFVADVTVKASMRGLRTSDGALIFQPSLRENTPGVLYGQPIFYPTNGCWDNTTALLVAGDFKQAVYAMRQDMRWKLLDQAVLMDNAGQVVYNLAQQGLVAMMVTMRMGWQVPNPINRLQGTEASRYPFGVLTPAS